MGTSAGVYIWLDAYVLHISCKLFSRDVGNKNIDNRVATTGWFQQGGEVDANSPQSTFISIARLPMYDNADENQI